MSIPIGERISCSVKDACQFTGIGKTTMFELMSDGTVKNKLVRGRRLVLVESLVDLVTPEDLK